MTFAKHTPLEPGMRGETHEEFFGKPQSPGDRLMPRMVTHSMQKIHRHDHAPMSTGLEMVTLEDCP